MTKSEKRGHGFTPCDCLLCRKAAQLVADVTKESAVAPSAPDDMEQLYRYLRARRRG